MSAEEDADLRDLVAHTLESNGVLGKIKAELRAKVFMVLEAHDKNETNQLSAVNESLRNFMNTKEGRMVTGLVREFLEYFELDYTLAVFDPETSFGDRYKGRAGIAEELSIDGSDGSKPLLSSLLEKSTTPTMPKLDFTTTEDKPKKGPSSPEISPRSSLSSGSRNNSPRISRIPQRVKEKKKDEKTETKAKSMSPETSPPDETKSGGFKKLGTADLSLSLNDDDLFGEMTKPRHSRHREQQETRKPSWLDDETSRPAQDEHRLPSLSNVASMKSPKDTGISSYSSDLQNLAKIDRRINELGFGLPAEDKSATDDYEDDFNPSTNSNEDNSIQEELEGDPVSLGSYRSESSKADDLITSDRVVSPIDFGDLDYKEDVENF